MDNYKAVFHDAVTDLITENIEDRSERIAAVHALTEAYIDSTGTRPDADADALDRLADLILREELTDDNPHKIAHTEYPILSERQFERRHSREVSLWVAEHVGLDGADHRPPKKRMRSKWENAWMDRGIKTQNRERKARYKREITPGPVTTYNLYDTGGELTEPFVACRGLGQRWANELGSVNETEIIREEAGQPPSLAA